MSTAKRKPAIAAALLLGVGAGTFGLVNAMGVQAAPVALCADLGTVTTSQTCVMEPGDALLYIARGGDGGDGPGGELGGYGALLTGTYANTGPADITLSLRVGEDGDDGVGTGGGDGGGFTAIGVGSDWNLEDVIVIAGGGGGGGLYSDQGGNGGYNSSSTTGGGNGGDECCDGGYEGGAGNTGGNGGVGTEPENDGGDGGDFGLDGEEMTRVDDANGNGGDGGDGFIFGSGTGGNANSWAGGGGAGYAGGGGGGAYNSEEGAAGGGGSSYFTGDAIGLIGNDSLYGLSGAQIVLSREPSVEFSTTTTEAETTTSSVYDAPVLANTGDESRNTALAAVFVIIGGVSMIAIRRRWTI
jgi:hypothetical protein